MKSYLQVKHITAVVASLLGWLSLCGPSLADTDIAALTTEIQRHESKFDRCMADVYTAYWEDGSPSGPSATEMRHVVQSGSQFYESLCKRDLLPALARPSCRFTVCNEREMTVYAPPDSVQQYAGHFERPAKFRPHSLLLTALGFPGTVSTLFSNPADSTTALTMEATTISVYNGLKTLSIRATYHPPEQTSTAILELRLAMDYDYLPYWGRLVEEDTVGKRRQIECESTFETTSTPTYSIKQRIRVIASENGEQEPPQLSKTIQVHTELQSGSPPKGLFQLTSFVGNPQVSVFENSQLKNSNPAEKDPFGIHEWPPYFIWFLINDAAIGAYVVLRLLMAVASRFRQRRYS